MQSKVEPFSFKGIRMNYVLTSIEFNLRFLMEKIEKMKDQAEVNYEINDIIRKIQDKIIEIEGLVEELEGMGE